MAGLDFYVNLLSGNMSGLSTISAMKSLDDSAAKATEGIKALEGQVEAAKAKLASLKDDNKVNELADDLRRAKEQLAAIKSGKVPFDPKEYKQASDAVGKLGTQLENAKAKQSSAIDAQKAKVESLTGKLNGAKEAYASNANLVAAKRVLVQKSLDEQVSSLGNIIGKAKEAGGPIGSLAGKLEGLGKGGAVGVAIAIVVALGALAVAGIAAAAAMTSYAIGAADAARSSKLFSEAATGSAKAGAELEMVVDQISSLAPGLNAKLKDVGRGLADVGIGGRDAQRVLEAFGVVATARGEQAAGAIKSIAEASRNSSRLMLGPFNRITGQFDSLRGTGIKSADVFRAIAKTMGTSEDAAKRAVTSGLVPYRKGLEAIEEAAKMSLGGVAAKQVMSLSAQAAKLKENVSKLFSGVAIDTFLAGLKTVTDLFDQNTVTGYVLREVFTAVFTKVAEVAAKVFPYVKAAIQGVVMGIILTVQIAKDLYKQFQQTFGGVGSNINGIMLAFKVGVGIVGLFVGSIVALTAAFVALGVIAAIALAPIWLPFALAAVLIYGVVKAITAVIDEAKSLGKEIEGIDLAGSAGKMIDGLVKGIKSKIADVKSAILEVSGAITGAFNSDQEIRSPGRKAMRQGRYVVEGQAIGMEQAVPMVERASMRASGAATRGLDPGQSSGATSSPGTSSPTFSFTGCTFGAVTQASIEEMMTVAYVKMQRGFAGQS